jgi:hypothetical protein
MLVLLLAPVCLCGSARLALARGTPVTSKSLKIDDSKWTAAEAKQEDGRFDNLVDKQTKKPAALAQSSNATANPQADAASDTSAAGSTSEGGSGWVWAILASLLVVGGGLTCFGYYWSNMRRVASW